jgi:hypothetical protein
VLLENSEKGDFAMKTILFRSLMILAVLVMLLGSFVACCCIPFDKGPDFNKIYNNLDSSVQFAWEVGSDGSYLKVDTNKYDLDDYSNWDVWDSIKEVHAELGLPDSLYSDMLETSWSMGKQTEVFEDAKVKVSWTYHPDKGLEATYKKLD